MQKFWQTLDAELLPALHKSDTAKAGAAYARLTQVYSAHRAVIDDLVEKANKLNADMETVAADRDRSISYVVWSRLRPGASRSSCWACLVLRSASCVRWCA